MEFVSGCWWSIYKSKKWYYKLYTNRHSKTIILKSTNEDFIAPNTTVYTTDGAWEPVIQAFASKAKEFEPGNARTFIGIDDVD